MSITNYPDADFTPNIPNSIANTGKQSYNPTGSFRFWAQKVLPTVYDDSLSYYEILTKVVNYLNTVIQNVDSLNESVDNTNSAFDGLQAYVNTSKNTLIMAYNKLQSYVNTYFDSLDVQEEINTKLDDMASDGSLNSIVSPFIPSAVSDWLSNNITPTSPIIDASLSISGAAADAKVTGDNLTALKSDLNNVAEIVYPNTDVVVASVPSTSQSRANGYYAISKLKAGNAYRIILTISDATHLYKIVTSKSESGSGNVDNITDDFVGESWETGKTVTYTPAVADVQYLLVQFNSAYVANEASISITVYDYTKETTTAIQELETANTEIIEAVDAITPEIYLEDEYNLLPPFGYTVNKLITVDGVVRDYEGTVLSDYIPIDPTQGYICNFAKTASVVYGNSALTGSLNTFERYDFCFFDENKNVVPFTGSTSTVSKAIPENARYIRVTIISEERYPFARLIYGNYETQPIVRICDYHKRIGDFYVEPNTWFEQFKMVMFGDSITHGSLSAGDNGISYVDYANDYLHSNIINVGFGGTRMTYSLSDAGLFCFYNLCDCIVSDEPNAWDDLIDYATNSNTSYLPHLNKLMEIDWTKVDAIGLMYGANDYASNTPIGLSYNETLTNFDGACAYGLKKLLTKYPHLQVLILTPFDREMTAGDANTMTDVAQNKAGLLMSDYANSLLNVQSRFHCPVIDTGKLFGVNQYNILTYAPDGTHPRANIAQKRLGWLFAKAVENNLAPFN